jgi:hypothetical protein
MCAMSHGHCAWFAGCFAYSRRGRLDSWPAASAQAPGAGRAVGFIDGLLVIGIGVALFALIETEKQIRLRLRG